MSQDPTPTSNPYRVCIIADGQVPHAQHWIKQLAKVGHEVHLISTFALNVEDLPIKSLNIVPLDFSSGVRKNEKALAEGTVKSDVKPSRLGNLRGSKLWKMVAELRNMTMPVAVFVQAPKVRKLIKEINPDIVHSMRITFEGSLAAEAVMKLNYPLLESVWGNDFTLFATKYRGAGFLTKRAMSRTNALHPDCHYDLTLARRDWGLPDKALAIVLPGNGGTDTSRFKPDLAKRDPNFITVVNPRSIKPYLRNDTFFAAVEIVAKRIPNLRVVAPAMKGKVYADELVAKHGLGEIVTLLPPLKHAEMVELFQSSDIMVSPSEHDGTPNSVLESMACGAFPIAGNIASLREWIVDGKNGLLFDPASPQELAEAIIKAIENPSLRESAMQENEKLIFERADGKAVAEAMDRFYNELVTSYRSANA